MPIPAQLTAFLDTHYPSPRVDPEWLDACFAWVTAEHALNPADAAHMPAIIEHVEMQLLQSDLCDSMSHGTGIPLNILTVPQGTLRGPVLVEITAITEVGASALALEQVRAAREERIAASAEAGDGEEEVDLEVDGEGPVPNYPRSMLRFELSDGATTLPAIEYRPMPELTLGDTPLGFKMILKNVLVRRGMAFLEPACVTFKGYQTEDRDAMQAADFARGLRQRLGRPEPEPQQALPPVPNPEPAPALALPPPVEIRSPLREISPPASPTLPIVNDAHHHSDDEDQPRRRRVPAPPASTTASTSSGAGVTSSYFSSSSDASRPPKDNMGLLLSPARMGPIEIDDSDSENGDENRVPLLPPGLEPRPIIGLKSSAARSLAPAALILEPERDPPSDDYGDIEMDSAFLEELAKVEAENTNRTSSSQASGSRRQPIVDADVITIDDDDDEDMEDKENVPAPQRHVRRRVFGAATAPEDVIDISDSD